MLSLWGFVKGILIKNDTDQTKQLGLEVDNTATTNTKTTLKSAQTANRTLTLPDGTDTLVGRDTSDTLTNKIIDADNNSITNLEHGAEVDNPSSGVHGVTGNVVGTSDAQTLTNKSIDADTNTITNIDDANIKALAGIDASKIADGSVSNLEFQTLDGVTSNIQTQIDNTNTAINDLTAADIDNVPSGNLSATDLQGAVDELQTDIDTRALDSDLTNHIADTSAHGVTGNVLGDSDTQTVTNKTIDADLNTISNLAHGAEVDNPSSGVHGVTGNIVGDSDIQTLTNKTIDADLNTISNLVHGAEVDNPTSGVHGVTGNIVGDSDVQDLSGKTFTDALTFQEQASTPTTPAAGDKKIYPKTDGKFYSLDDAGNEIEFGAGAGGSGSKTYIEGDSSNFETGIGDWQTFNDGATKLIASSSILVDELGDAINFTAHGFLTGQKIVYTTTGSVIGGLTNLANYYIIKIDDDLFALATSRQNAYNDVKIDLTSDGSGDHLFAGVEIYAGLQSVGTSDLTLTTTTTPSEVLAGTQSGKVSKPASNTQYHGFAVTSQTVDREDRGNTFVFRMSIDASHANYVSGDLKLYAYDVTNNRMLAVQSVFDENNEIPFGNNKLVSTVYTTETTEEIRMILGVNSTSTLAWDVFYDSVKVGPDSFTAVDSEIVNEINLAGNDGRDISSSTESIPFNGTGTGWTSGADGSTPANGNYYTVQEDDSFIQIDGSILFAANVDSKVTLKKNGSTYKIIGTYDLDNSLKFHFMSETGEFVAGDKLALTVTTSATLLNSSDAHYLKIRETKRISNVISSTDALLKSAKTYTNIKTPTGTLGAAYNKVTFTDIDKDKLKLYNTTTGQWTAPSSGTISGSAQIEFTHSLGNITGVVMVVNTTTGKRIYGSTYNHQATLTSVNCVGELEVNRGDILEIQSYTDASSPSFTVGNTGSSFSISYIPDLVKFGEYTNRKTYKTEIPNQFITSDDTWEDVTGTSLTVEPGIYNFNFDTAVDIRGGSETAKYGSIAIYDSSNNLLEGSITLQYSYPSRSPRMMNKTVWGVVVTETTTFKLRYRKSTFANEMYIGGDSYTGNLTDPDVNSLFQIQKYA